LDNRDKKYETIPAFLSTCGGLQNFINASVVPHKIAATIIEETDTRFAPKLAIIS